MRVRASWFPNNTNRSFPNTPSHIGPLFRIFLMVITFSTAICQRADFVTPEFALNRMFWWSSDWPITRFLNDNAEAELFESSHVLLGYIAHVEDAVMSSLSDRRVPHPDDGLHPCNFEFKSWFKSVGYQFGYRGWPDANQECITEMFGTQLLASQKPLYSVDQIYDALTTRKRILDTFARNITDAVGLGNWTEPEVTYKCPFTRLTQQCVVSGIGALRVDGNWNMMLTITNSQREQQHRDFDRQYVIEFHRVSDGKFAQPLLMRLPRRAENGSQTVIFENATTALDSWVGSSPCSTFGRTDASDNPAVSRALEETDLLIQQAADAMAPSEISILAVPLLLNLVPISLFAEVGTLKMLLYIVFSDVLTAIPMAIKGVELLYIGLQRRRSVLIRITSTLNGTRSETSGAELWAAECGAVQKVSRVGIVFLVIALVSIIVGIVSELFAREYVKTRQGKRRLRLYDRKSLHNGNLAEDEEFPESSYDAPHLNGTSFRLFDRRRMQ